MSPTHSRCCRIPRTCSPTRRRSGSPSSRPGWRPGPARGGYTYGLRRLEILSAQANGITLVLLAVWLAYEAIRRLISPQPVAGGLMLGVALVGVAVNLAASWLLARANGPGGRRSLNLEGALQHVLTDLYAFAATVVAAIVVLASGFNRADPIATLVVVVLMLWAGSGLIRASGRIFLEAAPAGLDLAALGTAMAGRPHVAEVHDLHIWEITTGMPAASAHVLVEPRQDCHAVRADLEELLSRDYGITHLTLQVDHLPESAGEAAAYLPPGHPDGPPEPRVRRPPRGGRGPGPRPALRGLPRPDVPPRPLSRRDGAARPAGQTARNSGDRRRASATTRAVPRLTTGMPTARTRKTVAPGMPVIRTTAALSGDRRAMTLPSPSAATWNCAPSRRLSTVASSACVTPLRGTRTLATPPVRESEYPCTPWRAAPGTYGPGQSIPRAARSSPPDAQGLPPERHGPDRCQGRA